MKCELTLRLVQNAEILGIIVGKMKLENFQRFSKHFSEAKFFARYVPSYLLNFNCMLQHKNMAVAS